MSTGTTAHTHPVHTKEEPMADTKRQRILDKIRKLQAKTTAMGCTEAEALAAAQTVGRLLDAYGLTLTDVELQSTTCIEDAVMSPFVTNRHPIRYCLDAIAGYCHTEHFFDRRPLTPDWTTWRTAYSFFGLPHDVEVAVYLTHVIMAAFDRESQTFKRTADYLSHSSLGKRESLKSFRYGMAQRIRERLLEMKAARDQDLKATGRDLVQVVGAVVSQAFAQAYPHIHTVGYQERPYNASAYHQGMAAGGRVGLHPGVKPGTPPLQLGAST
jgi:hypothetical protein